MHISPAMLEFSYEYLRASRPFNRWKLPEADDIAFNVTMAKDYYGFFQQTETGKRSISVSAFRVGHALTLLSVMAHEMVHLRLALRGEYPLKHSSEFRRLAAVVCREHGFDPRAF